MSATAAGLWRQQRVPAASAQGQLSQQMPAYGAYGGGRGDGGRRARALDEAAEAALTEVDCLKTLVFCNHTSLAHERFSSSFTPS